jgi:hypothetical protein
MPTKKPVLNGERRNRDPEHLVNHCRGMLPLVLAHEKERKAAGYEQQEHCGEHAAAQPPHAARPPAKNVARRDPAEQIHRRNGRYAVKQEQRWLEWTRYHSEGSALRNELIQDQPPATGKPQRAYDDIDGYPRPPRHAGALTRSPPMLHDSHPAAGRSTACQSAISQRMPSVTCSEESVAPEMFLMSVLKRT